MSSRSKAPLLNAPNPNAFDLPTAERLAKHLAEHPPVQPTPVRGWVLLAAAGGLLLISPALLMYPVLMLPVAVAGLVAAGVFSGKVHQARALRQRVVRAWELAMLRHHREALRRAWGLLPLVAKHPELHLRCVTVFAHVLDEQAGYDAALVAMDHLLAHLPDRHPMALQVRLQRANAALCSDQLADADDALRKLRGTIDTLPPGPLPAGYHLARLVQDVRTGHFTDAAEQADNTATQLRPLGVYAGYGYGLLAYCQHQTALRADDPQAADTAQRAARRLWHMATLLVPPAALAFRYRELEAMPTDPPTPPPTEPLTA